MCMQCLAETVFYNEIVPGFYLVKATKDVTDFMTDGQYGLVRQNDPDFVFDAYNFRPDPTVNEDEINNQYFEWLDEVDKFNQQLEDSFSNFRAVYELYKACEITGWDSKQLPILAQWLFPKIGEVIELGPTKQH